MRKRDEEMIREAVAAALRSKENVRDPRTYLHGAIGLRRDGLRVSSRNVSGMQVAPSHHAEARLCKKLTWGSEVWVARITRDGLWANSRPCEHCAAMLGSRGVSRLVYTTGPGEWEAIRCES